MNLALMKMWFALGSMGLMFLAVASIYLSRFKCQNRFFEDCDFIIRIHVYAHIWNYCVCRGF